ncbi:hypothetical protein EPO33_04035 [Patescibacteria group bacterium]|nr:MAG: hypothetical protein EPO33_04035 [Patescibacteria group bacterium]
MFRKTLLLTLVGTLLPMSALAATFAGGETYALGSGMRIDGDLYAAGASVSVGGNVTGDLYAAGGSVTVTGAVGQDVVVAGGNLTLLGSVGDDVRVAGGQIAIGDRIGGDLVVAGGMVHLLPGSEVGGDLIIAAGQAVVEGTVKGKLILRGGAAVLNGALTGPADVEVEETLSIGDAARFGSALVYRASQEASVAAGAVLGEVRREPLPERMRPEKIDGGALVGLAGLIAFGKLLAALGAALVAVWLFRKGTQQLVTDAVGDFWPMLGRGFATGILMPIAAFLLLITVILSPIGALTGAAFALLLVAAKILSGILFGAWLIMAVKKQKKPEATWQAALLGTFLLHLLWLIPLLGWIIAGIFCTVAFGALAIWARGILKPLASS